MCGLARSRSRATVANTTGVSSTTVASRLSTAVTVLATANTSARSVTGLPREPVAIQVPAASNRPNRSHRLARTRTAARKPMVGARLVASAPAWLSGRTPRSRRRAAAGTAITASGNPQGRTIAQTNVGTRSRPASVSAIGLDTVLQSLRPRGRGPGGGGRRAAPTGPMTASSRRQWFRQCEPFRRPVAHRARPARPSESPATQTLLHERGRLPAGVGGIQVRPRGNDLVNAVEGGRVEGHLGGSQLALQVLHRARTDDRRGHPRMLDDEGDSEMDEAHPGVRGELGQRFDGLQLALVLRQREIVAGGLPN